MVLVDLVKTAISVIGGAAAAAAVRSRTGGSARRISIDDVFLG